MRGIICVDGELIPATKAGVSPLDRGLLYGDGLFETIRVYGGRPFRLGAHLERLRLGCETLQFAGVPLGETIGKWTEAAILAADLGDAYCRITVTRGVGIGLDPLTCERATVLVAVLPLRPRAKHEVAATILWPRSDQDLPPLTVKSTSYQRAVLVAFELRRRGVDEGIFLDRLGDVAESTTANVFAVVGGKLVTPPTNACLAGITRAEVLDVARELGIEAEVVALPVDRMKAADEVFLTSSIAELVPVTSLDGHRIGGGVPGAMTRRLHDVFRGRTRDAR